MATEPVHAANRWSGRQGPLGARAEDLGHGVPRREYASHTHDRTRTTAHAHVADLVCACGRCVRQDQVPRRVQLDDLHQRSPDPQSRPAQQDLPLRGDPHRTLSSPPRHVTAHGTARARTHMAHLVALTTLSLVRFRFVQDITMEKGGTSVIADGYLVHGVMTEEEALFAFGFGVVRLLRHPPPIDAPTAPNHTHDTHTTHNTHSACNWSTICRTPSRTLRSTTRRSSPTAGPGSSPVRDTSRIHFSFRFNNFRFVFRFRFRFVFG